MSATQTQPTDLLGVISQGAMKAVVLIADRANIKIEDQDLDKIIPALRTEIQNGYSEAAHDAKEALQAMGEPMAKATLNASINLMATRALRSAGYLETRVDEMLARAERPTGSPFVENTVLGPCLTAEGWKRVSAKFPGNVQTHISQRSDGVYMVLVSEPSGRNLGSVRLEVN